MLFRSAAQRYAQEAARGEIVLVIEGACQEREQEAFTPEQAAALARRYMEEGASASEAARKAAKDTGIKKGEIYRGLVER